MLLLGIGILALQVRKQVYIILIGVFEPLVLHLLLVVLFQHCDLQAL